MVRCGCRLDCGGKGTDLKTQTKIGVISKKKKKGQRLFGCKIFSLLGLKMTQIVELTADDLFFFFGDHPNFRLWFQICTIASTIKPATASHRPAFDKKKRWRGHKFRLVKIRHPMS